MPVLIAALGGLLLNLAASLVGRVLLALGIGFVAYSGADVATDWLVNQIKSNMAGMPADTVNFLAWLWVDKAMSMLFSAYSVAMVFKLAGSTTIKRMVHK